jgi:hypothetical protein
MSSNVVFRQFLLIEGTSSSINIRENNQPALVPEFAGSNPAEAVGFF